MKNRLFLVAVLGLLCLHLNAQDPWMVQTSSPLDKPYFGIATANGQIGLVSSSKPLQVEKVIIGGLYDACGKGNVDAHFPTINPLTINLTINGIEVSEQTISNYTQSFDFRDATFHGQFDVADLAHVDYTILALRQLPFGFMMDVKVQAKQSIDVNVTNTHTLPEQLHGTETCFRPFKHRSYFGASKYIKYVLLTTKAQSPTGRWDMAATTSFVFPDVKSGGIEVDVVHSVDSVNHTQSQSFSESAQANQTMHFALVGSVLGNNVVADVMNQVQRLTIYQLLDGYTHLWACHNAAWAQLWQSDILVDGPKQDQQDIHMMLYHLYAFNREGSGLSCAPMGVSGLGYNGHMFWDDETWMFPALAIMQPQIAKEMLNYRFNRMAAAKTNAYMHGYKGAWFPWESAYTGEEETPLPNVYSEGEIHLTSDVAIAAWQYYCLTGDKQWLRTTAWPILQSTADFWVSRVEWDGAGRANLNNVIGADEWTCNQFGGKNINNNAYTIGSTKINLIDAIKAAKVLGEKAPKEWQQTADGLRFDYMENGVIAEHSTYDGHPVKQADVVLLAYPLHLVTDKAQIRRDLEYYMPKTPDEKTPAMSKSIYSILYNRLGEPDKALFYFRGTYLANLTTPFRLIAEFNGGTNPYFMTGAGGMLQSLLFGFAGLDITDKGLKQVYKTQLPSEWKSLTIRLGGQDKFHIQNK